MLVEWRRRTLLVFVTLLMLASDTLTSDSVKCYTCENVCGPDKEAWNVTQCAGSCRMEFMKLPGTTTTATTSVTIPAKLKSVDPHLGGALLSRF